MPPMPPGGIGGVFSFSGISVTNASVVSNRPAMDAAFCSALRDLRACNPSFVDVISWATGEKLGLAAMLAHWSAVFR